MTKNTKQSRARSHTFAGQHDDEVVVVVERQHPIVMRRQLLLGMIVFLIVLLPWFVAITNDYSWLVYANWLIFIGVALVAFFWLRTWVGWYYSVYVLTNQRIRIGKQNGFFSREFN